jgi:hypothetical protein
MVSDMKDELMDRIEAFLTEHEMTASAFGLAALNDPGFVFDLRNGREVRRATRQKATDFMDRHARKRKTA